MRLILIITVSALAPACGDASAPRAEPGHPLVVAGFFPLGEVARNVGGQRAEVRELVRPGVEPHDVELDPGQADLLLEADLVITVRGVQPTVDDLVATRAGGGSTLQVPTVGGDPHVWLDPIQMEGIAKAIGRHLGRIDPAGKQDYEQGTERFVGELSTLHEEYLEGLAGCEGSLLVVSHAAFGHLAARYGLRQEPITGRSPETEPDPARLAELVDLIAREKVRTIFTEPLAPPDAAETLAREAGVRTAVLNPIEGLTEAQAAAGETYLSLMAANLRALRRGLSC